MSKSINTRNRLPGGLPQGNMLPDQVCARRHLGILVGNHADRTIEDVYAEVQQVLQAATAR